MSKAKIVEAGQFKFIRSEDYNLNFDYDTGRLERWGKTLQDDPDWSPFGPEIMDIEITADGGCPQSCPFCYKGNKAGGVPTNMSLDTFKTIFATFPKTITQIAFGITSISANPDLFPIFEFCRENRVIPNVTISSGDKLTDEQVDRLVKLCGAMAFSVYSFTPRDTRYDLIARFIAAGLKQCNIHFMISKQTIKFAYEVCEDIKSNPKLKGLNAIVFLGLKPKSRGQSFDVLPTEDYITLVNYCLDNQIPFGFDSCSAPRFEKAVSISSLDDARKQELMTCSERCESGLFSAYIDAKGRYWHCSFGEDREDAFGIDVTTIKDFNKEVWYAPQMVEWRKKLFGLKRECPLYSEIHS
jgi:MoaA/NifB/PqqE/SkfB family radical SAM enzyme